MARPIPFAETHQPMVEMNTTPLIDVMLVLLIMMILTVPVVTHKVAMDLPGDARRSAVPPPVHRLDIAASGALSWDGAAISAAALPARLAALRADAAGPVLHIRPDGEAPYGLVDETLATVKRARIEKIGLVDNARFATGG
ncbi:outer membrane transport energization protein ExbD [Sphingomonas laterariae]|uniref:Outer membrane transport energization protein ExbD n=1 Tax=Edaphosphingomonas laterariae TaxID=861865 RepID=A0A239BVZ3_9SPHN|nr:biopolymer transporter ExbD [Sphingomonas laterariae]SNS12215.1 outer membrane transport energization protein ExbD [Sphingomonas laterariae]